MVNTLVLGSAGYIGSRLVQRLVLDDDYVVGIDKLMYANSRDALLSSMNIDPYVYSKRFTFHKIDLTKQSIDELISKADVVYLLAALVGQPICDRLPQEAIAINLDFVKKLVGKLSKNQRLIFPNTNSSYGAVNHTEPLTEESPLNPISLYGRTKAEAERYILDNHENSIVLRLGTVFGLSPRMRYDLIIHDFIAKCLFEQHIDLFQPTFVRNFIHIDDVVNAMRYFGTKVQHIKQEVFNLNQPQFETKQSLADFVARSVQAIFPSLKTNVTLREGNDPDQRNYNISVDKITQQTNFDFNSFELHFEDIEDVIKYTALRDKAYVTQCSNLALHS